MMILQRWHQLLLGALALILACALPSFGQVTGGAGPGFVAFSGDNGKLDNVEALATNITFELELFDEQNHYLGIGMPLLADADELLWNFNLDYRRRIAHSDAFFYLGTIFNFAPSGILEGVYEDAEIPEDERGTAIFMGPRIGFWFGIPMGDEQLLPLEVSAFLSFHVAGMHDDIDNPPELIGFSLNYANELLQGRF